MKSLTQYFLIICAFISTASAQVITSVDPDSAYQGQSLAVSITGQNTHFMFVQGSETIYTDNVWFSQGSSTIAASSVAVYSNTSLSADFDIQGSAPTGLWDVNVEQVGGYGVVSLNNGFTIYAAPWPVITSVEPDNAHQGQSLPISITGQNTHFAQGSGTLGIWFSQGTSTISASSFSVNSNTSLSANFNIPTDAPTGLWDVSVQTDFDGTMTLNDGFTINPTTVPIISSVTPDSAYQGQSLTVSITGQNTHFMFVQGSETIYTDNVWFSQGSSTIAASSVAVYSNTSLSADFDIQGSAPTGLWDVNVEQVGGYGVVSFNNGFTIYAVSWPVITSVVPDSAYQGQSLAVSITGQNTHFAQGSGTYYVWFTQDISTIYASSFSVISNISLSANFNISTIAPTGLWDVSVRTDFDGTMTLNEGFTINPDPSAQFTTITTGDIVNDGGWSLGSIWGDYDNDSDLDLFVANYFNQNNFLYSNNGDGTFIKITTGAIVNDGGRSSGSSWGDYDNNGDLDLFVANYDENFLYSNNGGGTFTKIDTGVIVTDVGTSPGGSWGDYDNDGYLDLFVANYGNNFLYWNNGNGTFTKITTGAIVNDGGFSSGSSWGDYDNDGYLDLFVTNYNENNFLYSNNGNGTFTKITTGAIVNDGGRSSGSSWGDYDNDGYLDLFVANDYQGQNFLYSNNGNGTFTRITTGAIVNDGGFSSGSSWGDYDNDGDLDLFVTNYNYYNQNNFFYSNNGDGTFTKIHNGIVNDGGNSKGSSWGDYDNDGDLDLFVANSNNQNNFLYSNNGNSNYWINIKCVGTVSNTSAIGAKVKVKTTIDGTSIWQMREISGQTGFGSQNSLNAEFGLGDATVIDSIKIEWPSGIVQVLTDVEVNQLLTITEEDLYVLNENINIPNDFTLSLNYPNPFNPITTIKYGLPRGSKVTLKVFDILGREVATLVAQHQPAGYYQINWDAFSHSSGIYFYQIQASEFKQIRKMILLK